MNKPILALKLMVLAWLCIANVQATIRYVKPGSASTAWQTKTNVYNDLTSALTAAVYGDEIWVAAGTYKPTTGTDRNISFNLKDGVAIYGGFGGTETQLTQRNWVTNPTILSGDIGVQGTDTDNSYNVVKAVGTSTAPLDNTTRLDGVIVEKGYSNTNGAGAYLNYANPVIVNTIFRNNFSPYSGGAVGATNSNSIFANTLFLSNRTKSVGGAVYSETALTFIHCTFSNNQAENYAAAVFSTSSLTKVVNSIVWGNILNIDNNPYNKLTYVSCYLEGSYTQSKLNSAPIFVDALNGDFRLNAASPCIDKGLNSNNPEWLTADFYGNPRLIGTSVDFGIAEGSVTTPILTIPVNKAVFPATTTTMTLDWAWLGSQPVGINGYEIELQLKEGEPQLLTSNGHSYTINNLAPGSTYKWRVRGIDGTVFKNWSPWATFSVKNSTPLYVKQGGTGNGSSWGTAMGSLQAAIDAAVYSDEIWVAAGTYKPTTGTDRNISFKLKDGVAIYGGFTGTETRLSQRNWVNNPTILSGDIGVAGDQNDNSDNVVKAIGSVDSPIDSTTRLDGLIIEKGYASYQGGGMKLSYASPIIVNTIFRNNNVLSYGGAVYASNSNSIFANTLFISNKSDNFGGAVYANSKVFFTHCNFINNWAGKSGGAVYGNGQSYPVITNSIAISNSAKIEYANFRYVNCNYSFVEDGNYGTGNKSSNPLLIDPIIGDCRLNAASECIDLGLNSATPTWLITDFYGNARLAGEKVDIGMTEGGTLTPLANAPTDNSILPGSTTSMNIGWTWPSAQPVNVTNYELEIQLNNAASQLLTTSNLVYTLSNTKPGSVYKWRVRGIDGSLLKNWSPWTTFSIKHNTPLYVKPDGTGDGLSWATAVGSLQEALGKAIYSDEIWVATGTYRPTSGTDRSISFNMKNGVAIYGGFTGTETELAQRNWADNPTILSGDIGVTGTDTDNTNIVVKAIGTTDTPLDSTTRLDGVIIEKGYATDYLNYQGGGLNIYHANLKVANTIFRNNFAERDGGAVYAYYSHSVFANTLFVSNKTNSSGGAVFSGANLTFTQCTFVNNRAESGIGAIFGNFNSQIINNSIAWGNSAKDGGHQFNAVTCTYSCVEGGYTGTGNISNDPLFVDAANGNFRLQQASPCINKALANSNPAWLTTDLDRLPRILNGYGDMGAYEAAYAVSMSPDNNQAHAQTAYMGSMLKWDIAPAVSNTEKQQVTCYYELWKSGVPATIIAQGQNKGRAEVNINPLDFNASYQWRVGVKTAGYTYWSTPATFYIGRENPIYVKTNGTGDGSSWANALGSVSSALELANPGDRIWVAAGTYKPSGTSRDAAFKLKPNVELLGGYTDGSTVRNPEQNITILSGDLGTLNDDSDNAYHVINNSYTVGTPLIGAVIDGFTITGGNAGSTNGGGMLNAYANPTVRYCKFIGNKAASGGAIADISSSPSIINSLLVKNTATAKGGAIYSDATSTPTIINNTIANNSAVTGGGLSGNGTVGNTIVYDNTGGQIEGTPTLTYSCVQGGFTGTGNITAAPRFKDADKNNYAIGPFSSCFDKGNSNLITIDFSTFDLSFSEMRNFVSSVDIGAYELKYPDIAARVEVTQATPVNEASGIDKSAPIMLSFNEPVTIFDQLGVTMASGIDIKSMTLSDDKKTLTLVPSENWPFNSAQKLLIANGAIRFADNTNFRMLDYETGFGIRACLPVTVAIDLLSPTSCPGTLATMTTKTTGDVLDYEWMFKQSVVASGTPSFSIQKLTADSTGVYYCNVTDMCGNVASAQAEVEFTEGILKPAIVKKWNDVYLVDNSSKRFSNYQWYANDVEKESGSQYITVSNPWVGQSLYVTVFDNKTGCHSTSDKTTISLNTKSVSVYPNPVANNQSVEIQLPTVATNTRVRLFDANGNLKAEESIKGVDNYSFDKTNFAPGVYTMEIVEAEEKTIVKLIIQ